MYHTNHAGLRLALVLVLGAGCGPSPGPAQPVSPPPPLVLSVRFPVPQPDGTIELQHANEVVDETKGAVHEIRAASLRLEVKSVARPTIEPEGFEMPEAITGSVEEIRRLRDRDDGYYHIDEMVPGTDSDPTPRWRITLEPNSSALLARLVLFKVYGGARPAVSTPHQLRLIFVPPDAPHPVVVQSRNDRSRRVDWTNHDPTARGFDIMESTSFYGGWELVQRVDASTSWFESDDRLPNGSINADHRRLFWQVCARPSAPDAIPRCSLPVSADGHRVSPAPCTQGIPLHLAAIQSQDNPTLYRATVVDLPSVVIAVSSSSPFPVEVRSRLPGYQQVPPNGRVPWLAPMAEGPWTVRVDPGLGALPATVPLTLEVCP